MPSLRSDRVSETTRGVTDAQTGCVLMASAAMGLLPLISARADAGHVLYTREAYKAALASGKPVLLDFYASW